MNARIYSQTMEEVKSRLNLLSKFYESGATTGSEVTDIEHGCLQFRKILELIALAGIASHKAEYAKLREHFHSDWNADRILKTLRVINPNFFPIPMIATPGENHHFAEIGEGFLTEDAFGKILNVCGDLLHATNPFGRAKDLAAVRKSFRDWATSIMTLLRVHRVDLPNRSTWLTIMDYVEDGKVHTFIAVPNVGRRATFSVAAGRAIFRSFNRSSARVAP